VGYAGAENPDYRLGITADSSATDIRPDCYEANDSGQTATVIREAYAELSDLSITQSDRDWFKFTQPQTGLLSDRIEVETDSHVSVTLYDANSRVLQTGTTQGASLVSLSLQGQSAGDYFVEVKGATSLIETTYDLRLNTTPPTDDQPSTSASGTWSMLVFMNGDNNLEPFAISDLNEMESASMAGDISVAVQIDRITEYDVSNGNWTDTRRGFVSHDSNSSTISSQLTSIGEIDMGSTTVSITIQK
jgi:hypothetical protein